MSDTPETDYETNDKSFIYTMGGLPTDVVHAEFARKLERERNSWKKAHDNQVKLKQIISDRPDLKERAKLVAELIEERDQVIRNYDMLKKLYDATALDRRNCVQTSADLSGQNHELIEERDGWREAAYSLAEALPPSWEELQPPAAQLAKFKEMVGLVNEKYIKKYNL